jgi:hypothetical protein
MHRSARMAATVGGPIKEYQQLGEANHGQRLPAVPRTPAGVASWARGALCMPSAKAPGAPTAASVGRSSAMNAFSLPPGARPGHQGHARAVGMRLPRRPASAGSVG